MDRHGMIFRLIGWCAGASSGGISTSRHRRVGRCVHLVIRAAVQPSLAPRRESQALPQEKPGWNLVVYRDHKPIFYTLQGQTEDCSWDRRSRLDLGETSFRRTTVMDTSMLILILIAS